MDHFRNDGCRNCQRTPKSCQVERTKAAIRSIPLPLPSIRTSRCNRSNRGSEWRRTEHHVRAAGAFCKLGCPPLSCDARIVLKFTDAEFDCLPMRMAVYNHARDLEWSTRKWLPMLQELQSKTNAHYTDRHGRIFDISFADFETEGLEGDDDASIREVEAVRCWFGEQFCTEEPFTIDTMPNLSEKGKERFKVTASILIAAYSDLEDELIRLANEGPDCPDLPA